jgi:hypothetical protein
MGKPYITLVSLYKAFRYGKSLKRLPLYSSHAFFYQYMRRVLYSGMSSTDIISPMFFHLHHAENDIGDDR